MDPGLTNSNGQSQTFSVMLRPERSTGRPEDIGNTARKPPARLLPSAAQSSPLQIGLVSSLPLLPKSAPFLTVISKPNRIYSLVSLQELKETKMLPADNENAYPASNKSTENLSELKRPVNRYMDTNPFLSTSQNPSENTLKKS